VAQASAVNLGAKMLQPLIGMLSGDDPVAKSGARHTLFYLVSKVSDLKCTKKDKRVVNIAIKKSIINTSSPITVNYFKWLLGIKDN
jgi:hypothetical protein